MIIGCRLGLVKFAVDAVAVPDYGKGSIGPILNNSI